jgi:transcription termination factor NusB
MNDNVLPSGYTTEEAQALFEKNLSKLPKQTRLTEMEQAHLRVQAAKQSKENPTN